MNTNNGGFTLSEVLVASLLLAVLGLAAASIFITYINDTRDLVKHVEVQKMYDLVYENFGTKVRQADYVTVTNDVISVWKVQNNVLTVVYEMTTGTVVDGLAPIQERESINDAFTPIKLANLVIQTKVHSYTLDGDVSTTYKKWIEIDYTIQNGDFLSESRKARFKCRN